MPENDFYDAIRNLKSADEVSAYLGMVGASPELRQLVLEHWERQRAANACPSDPSLIDSNSLELQNTILFEDSATPASAAGEPVPDPPISVFEPVSHDARKISPDGKGTETPDSSKLIRFGRYEARRELGRGAFGKVYLGFDPQLNRHVAIKAPKFRAGDDQSRAQFLLEARQLAALKHPGIVSVYDISVDGEQCFIVSDYLEGPNLHDWLKGRRIEWPQTVQICIRIADALAHAHANRIVHRDLKPANIIMTSGDNPVLVDFGLAISDSSSTGDERGVVTGTPAYMSPEQARGEGHRIDGRTDIYTLGVMMYLMLTGRLPFTARRVDELLRQVQKDEPQPPRQLNPIIPRELEKICLTAMAKSLRHRYTTAGDMADDLRKVVPTSGATLESIAMPMPETIAPFIVPPVVAQPQQSVAIPIEPTVTTPLPPPSAVQVDLNLGSGNRSSSIRRSGSSSSGRRVREAERRRVTVVKFSCDVFTSEEILESLDAEEQDEILKEFQQLCREVSIKSGGTIAQITEDGLRACFGYPIALEDATQRAIRAAMDLIESMIPLRDKTHRKHKVELTAIAAVHSDHAVVQDTGEEGSLSIVGSLLNFVGQLDTVADPNSVVISRDTYQLVQRYFECESLGQKRFKGGPQEVYLVKAERPASSRVDLVEPESLTPLIGRDREVGLLQERWEQAAEGMGQVVLLIGDAGLGKSRLVHTLKEHVLPGITHGSQHQSAALEHDANATIIEWRCSAQHHGSAFFPPTECFERLLGFERRDSAKERLDKLVDHLAQLNLDGDLEIALLASMLSIPLEGRFPPLEINPQLQKEKTFELLWDWLREQAADRPVLFILEDLHWLDPTTLEFIEQIVAKGANDPILILLTFRPEFVTPWKSIAHQTQFALNRLTKRQIGEMIVAQAGREIPQNVIDQIAERTDGVPLFVEEFTRTIIESDPASQLADASSSGRFRTHEIPATLQDLLIARLDRMTIDIEVAQLAATIGREFSYEVIRAVSTQTDQELQSELQKLVAADLLSERGRPPRTKYTFRHALIQDAAYGSLIKKKRQQFHQQIGDALESQFADTANTQPEILATHFTEAGDVVRAIDYWDRAGTRSLERRAFKEAIQQLRSGLGLLREQPESPERFRHEIKMHTALGVPLQATIGYSDPEVEANYARARELCGQLGLTTELFPVLYGMFRYYMLQAKYVQANELASQLVTLSAQSNAPDFIVASNRAMGSPLVYEGKHHQAIPFLKRVASIEATLDLRAQVYRYDVVDPWIVASSYMSWAYWLLGSPAIAQKHSDDAVHIAEALDHSFSLTLALSFSQWIHQFNRDVTRTRATAEKALSLAKEQGFAFWYGWCRVMRGWAMSQQGEHAQGIAEIEEGLVEWRAQGSELGSHYYYALLAEASLAAGQLDKAATALDQAEQFAISTGEGFYLPEIPRLRGKLLLTRTPSAIVEAEALFRKSLELASSQDAKSLELRAARSLARLLHSVGRTPEAAAVLTPIVSQFGGSVDTYDLRDACRLLDALK